MSHSRIGLVIEREYRERVAKKSFIITTILMPVLMLALAMAPTAIMMLGSSSTSSVLVIDQTGYVANGLESDTEVAYLPAPKDVTVDSALRNASVDGVLVIPQSASQSPKPIIKYYSNGPTSMTVEKNISGQLEKIIEGHRLKAYNIDNLDRILDEVKCDVSIQTIRNDKESQEAESSGLAFGLGILLTFVLYMFLLLYGQMVMTSIIEEKNNRVLEVIVSSVKPAQLMLGKITGIALVALTQILIWGVLLVVITMFVVPAFMPESLLEQMATVQAGNTAGMADVDHLGMIQALNRLTDMGYIITLIGTMTIFLILGFFFYSAIYAAIGSSVDNIQDAGQLQSIIVLPIILGLICAMQAANDPSSGLAFWLSMIPFTSPMVMMARIPFGIPGWEIVVSLAVLSVSFVAMVWVAAKIYRVGIFMYGKKPTFKDLIRWVNYK